MAGFGLSLSDIVLFGQFTATIISALRESGSKTEYQFELQSCQDLQAVLEEIQKLDESNVGNSFGEELKEYTSNAKGLVEDFNKTIAKYEKSMGKTSEAGSMKRSARKIQWALAAASDLDIFRKRLSTRLDIVKLTMQSRIYSMVAELHQQPRLLAPHEGVRGLDRMALVRHTNPAPSRIAGLLEWNAVHGDEDIFERVHEMTEMLYSWMATRDTKHQSSPMRIHTLLEDGIGQTLVTNHAHESLSPALTGLSDVPQYEASNSLQVATSLPHEELVGNTNELLQALNLTKLTDNEARELNNDNAPFSTLLASWSSSGDANSTDSINHRVSDQLPQSAKSKSQKPRFRMSMSYSNVIGAAGLGPASFVLQVLDASLAAYTNLNNVRKSETELVNLGKRMGHYLALMPETATILSRSTSKAMLDLGKEVLRDTSALLDNINSILKDRVGDKANFLRKLRWQKHREAVQEAMQEIESLKVTITIMTQMHLVEIQEKNMAKTELYFRHAEERRRLEEILGARGMMKANGEANQDGERRNVLRVRNAGDTSTN